jgi:sugar phosphate isomerase/epimerase
MDFSIQLYSVRHELESKGFPAVLEKLGAIGYTGVEFAGYGGLSAVEMKALLERHNLRPVGAHIGLERLETAPDEELTYHKVLGTAYIVVPSAPFGNPGEVADTAERLKALAPKITGAGFRFAYHNHGAEFERDGGLLRIERLIAAVPAVEIQLDVYWASRMGCDCEDFIRRHAPRVTSLHIKQADKNGECVDLGDGVLDFKALIETGRQNGAAEFIHEQETFAGDPFEGLARGFAHIQGLRSNS